MNNKQLVAIILVNYQSYGDTLECIESILDSDSRNYRIFVVDNSSSKEKQQSFLQRLDSLKSMSSNGNSNSWEIKEEHAFDLDQAGKLITVINAENKGFAAANNIILKQ